MVTKRVWLYSWSSIKIVSIKKMGKNIKVSQTFGCLNKSVKFSETKMVQLSIKILLLVS